MHEIRFCQKDEYQLLIDFLDSDWKKDHIFTLDKKLLDWQHLNIKEDRYNFVVAYNTVTKEFDAILGFIPASQYDSTLIEHNELWLAIWKIKDSMADKVSGIQLLFYLKNKLKPTTICSVGITENVKEIYDAFKYKRDSLRHYYITSDSYKPSISNISAAQPIYDTFSNYKIKEICFDDYVNECDKIILGSNSSIIKSISYIKKRFIFHPTYKYTFYGIFSDDILDAFFIVRKVTVKGNSCLRIVDYYGEFIHVDIGYGFQKILSENSSEYIDLLCHVPDTEKIKTMGFLEKMEDDIIPEYFEPFVQKNVTIDFAFKSKKDICIFKADSDQDRPTLTKSENT